MWGQVWVSVTGVLVIFSCKAESLEDRILGETLFDSSRHLVCRHCLGIRLIKARASQMKVSWATVPGLLWERKRKETTRKNCLENDPCPEVRILIIYNPMCYNIFLFFLKGKGVTGLFKVALMLCDSCLLIDLILLIVLALVGIKFCLAK